MQNKYLKIVVLVLLALGVVYSLSFSLCQKTNWSHLMKENVEALTTPEDSSYPCVKAHGFCIVNNIEKDGIIIID